MTLEQIGQNRIPTVRGLLLGHVLGSSEDEVRALQARLVRADGSIHDLQESFALRLIERRLAASDFEGAQGLIDEMPSSRRYMGYRQLATYHAKRGEIDSFWTAFSKCDKRRQGLQVLVRLMLRVVALQDLDAALAQLKTLPAAMPGADVEMLTGDCLYLQIGSDTPANLLQLADKHPCDWLLVALRYGRPEVRIPERRFHGADRRPP